MVKVSDVKIHIEINTKNEAKVEEIADKYQLDVKFENNKAQLKLFYADKIDIDDIDKYDGYTIIKEGSVVVKLLKELKDEDTKIDIEADGCAFMKLLAENCLFLNFGI